MTDTYPEFSLYPSSVEIDRLVAGLWKKAERYPVEVEVLDNQGFSHSLGMRHMKGFAYVRFQPQGMAPFYGYWQPAPSQPAPLLVHTPGYGAEIQVYPDLVAQGYNVLHVNPLGYATPDGPDESRRQSDTWPVFYDTVHSGFDQGYGPWLINVMQAVAWAQGTGAVLPERIGFFGTSQGGGASLLLGSIFRDRGCRCVAADEPWLVHFPLYRELQPAWAETLAGQGGPMAQSDAAATNGKLWYELGKVDAMAHAHRLTIPVLLTAGGADATCPPATIRALYDRLPTTKSLTWLDGVAHGYTQALPYLAGSWFRMWL